jgi:hypothetical protein
VPPPTAAKAGRLAPVKPAGTLHSTTKPRITKGNFLARIKARLGIESARVTNATVQQNMKRSIQERVGTRLQQRMVARHGGTKAFELARELADEVTTYGRTYAADTPFEALTQQLVRNWAATSGDSHRYALAMQRAAAKKFDLPWPPIGYDIKKLDRSYGAIGSQWEGKTLGESVDIILAKYGDTMDDFLDAMYEETQEELARLHPSKDTIRLVRGMSHEVGASTTIQHLPIMLNPMSSFALNQTTAKRFGRTLLYVDVPKERIIGSTLSGYGCLNEYEFVVIGAAEPEIMGVIRA